MATEELNVPAAFKRFRKEFGLTKSEMARALGIAPTSYKYEQIGESNNPTAKTLFRLAKAYNVSIDYLLGLTDVPTPHWSTQENLVESELHENSVAAELAEIKTRLAQIELALKDAGIKIAASESK